MKHMSVPEGFEVRLFAAEPEIGKPLCMAWDEPRAALDRRDASTTRTTSSRRAGARPDQDLRRHRRRRPGRQVHGLRRQAQHPHQHRLLPTAESSSTRRPDTLFLQDNDGDGKADESNASSSPAGARAIPTPGRATCAGASTTGSGASSATRGSTARSAARTCVSAGASTGSSPTARSSSSCAARTTTPGASASARRACSSARRPTATRASTCRSRTATTSRSGAGRPASWAASPTRNRFLPITEKVRQVDWSRRLHGRRGPRALHGADLSRGVLEPHRLRRRADRPPGRHVRCSTPRERLPLAQRLEPVRQRRRVDFARSWPRSGPTAMSG